MKLNKKFSFGVLAGLLALSMVFVGCKNGSGGSGDGDEDESGLTKITLNNISSSMIAAGPDGAYFYLYKPGQVVKLIDISSSDNYVASYDLWDAGNKGSSSITFNPGDSGSVGWTGTGTYDAYIFLDNSNVTTCYKKTSVNISKNTTLSAKDFKLTTLQ